MLCADTPLDLFLRALSPGTVMAVAATRFLVCSSANTLRRFLHVVSLNPMLDRALFGGSRAGLGLQIGLVETKVTGENTNPLVR